MGKSIVVESKIKRKKMSFGVAQFRLSKECWTRVWEGLEITAIFHPQDSDRPHIEVEKDDK